MSALILLVDDEPVIVRLARMELEANGYEVAAAYTGEDALRLTEDRRPDLIVLDILMPGMDGIEVLRRLPTGERIPVIFLTARDAPGDQVFGLAQGADDYMTKPFNPVELVARVGAVLRRRQKAPESRGLIAAGDIAIDLDRWVVTKGGTEVPLTAREWEVLHRLAMNPDKTVPSHALVDTRRRDYSDPERTVRITVSRLRHKLDPAQEYIRTHRGLGYGLWLGEHERPESRLRGVEGSPK